jgi:autotransporter-associated beta strand protein
VKANRRRALHVARVVFFLGCTGAVFAHSGWVRPFDEGSWRLGEWFSSYSLPIRLKVAEQPARDAATASTGEPNEFARAVNDVILGRGKFFASGARRDLTVANVEQNELPRDNNSWVVAAPQMRFESLGGGSATRSSYSAIQGPVAPPRGVVTPDNPPAANAIWRGSGGTTAAPTSGNWSNAANWSTNVVPTPSDTVILEFGGSSSTPYASTNDLGAFTFESIYLKSTASVIETINGNTLQLPAGSATPTGYIMQFNSGAVDIQNNITANPNAGLFTNSNLELLGESGGGTGTVTLSGVLSNASSSQKLQVTKDGQNTFVLTGANTYTGGTMINGGTLLVNNTTGSGTGGGLVNVNNGGTLGGDGTITVTPVEGQAQVNVYQGGTIAPGAAAGQIGALTLNDSRTFFDSGSKLLVDLNSTTSDLLSTTGLLSITAGATINFNQLAAPTASSYQLATYSNVSGMFTPLNLPSGYTLVYNPTELDLVAAPEPATWAAAALAALGVGVAHRRRVRRHPVG